MCFPTQLNCKPIHGFVAIELKNFHLTQSDGVTQTTLELFNYWFRRDEEATERFHPCQQRAIETIVYCHEILQTKTLQEVFERIAPESLHQHLPLKQEVETIPFPKYALKMATGSGKTWV